MTFVDVEKAFDRVPREVVCWSLRSLYIWEWLVSVVQQCLKMLRWFGYVERKDSDDWILACRGFEVNGES